MVGNSHPGKTGRLPLLNHLSQAGKKVFFVSLTLKYLFSLDPPDHDRVQVSGGIQPWSSWHTSPLSYVPYISTELKLLLGQLISGNVNR